MKNHRRPQQKTANLVPHRDESKVTRDQRVVGQHASKGGRGIPATWCGPAGQPQAQQARASDTRHWHSFGRQARAKQKMDDEAWNDE